MFHQQKFTPGLNIKEMRLDDFTFLLFMYIFTHSGWAKSCTPYRVYLGQLVLSPIVSFCWCLWLMCGASHSFSLYLPLEMRKQSKGDLSSGQPFLYPFFQWHTTFSSPPVYVGSSWIVNPILLGLDSTLLLNLVPTPMPVPLPNLTMLTRDLERLWLGHSSGRDIYTNSVFYIKLVKTIGVVEMLGDVVLGPSYHGAPLWALACLTGGQYIAAVHSA